jgi:hypothetical protein
MNARQPSCDVSEIVTLLRTPCAKGVEERTCRVRRAYGTQMPKISDIDKLDL